MSMLQETMKGPSNSAHSNWQAAFKRLTKIFLQLISMPLPRLGLIIIGVLILMAMFAPLFSTHDPLVQELSNGLQRPDAEHWFGTDQLGRDIFSRVVYGSRYTLLIVFIVAITVGPIGVLVGATSGYLGGTVDTVLMRITDLFLSIPGLVLALALVGALGAGLENAILAISITAWPPIARLARAETLTIRKSDYILAVRLMGASSLRIIVKHVLPMLLPSVVVRLTLNMAGIILTAAGLGFLGLGAQPPVPEWGAMTADGRNYLIDAWWIATLPGAAILIVSLSFNLVGDGLRDALDPRSEH